MMAGQASKASYQAHFERRWGHLARPHVRALAWLLDAPDLLDRNDPYWEGRIATLGPVSPAVADWLAMLERDPYALHASLGDKVYTRLGLYAEKLMAFYYRSQGLLVAHGLQVRAARNDTVGEFDFLLEAGEGGVEHIEFATKFYLLEGEAASRFDTFVGPNLADSLGAKMRKIFERQLALGGHPAAQAVLPRPVTSARALVKGWLFYPPEAQAEVAGITAAHCSGSWCAASALADQGDAQFVVLPRLQWLAPYRGQDEVFTVAGLQTLLTTQFEAVANPVLVAAVKETEGGWVETSRTFVVPEDWQARAQRYVSR